MSLRWKFGLLLALIGLAVAINVGVVWWAVSTLQHQLTTPLAAVDEIMTGLGRLKRGIGELHNLISEGEEEAAIGPSPADTDDDRSSQVTAEEAARSAVHAGTARGPVEERRGQITMVRDRVLTLHAALEQSEYYSTQTGVVTARTLRDVLADAVAHTDAWLSDPRGEGATASLASARDGFFSLHELIEHRESGLLQDARGAVEQGPIVKRKVLGVVGVTVAIVLLVGFLSVRLMQWWVLTPTAVLRQAARRIGSGDLAHRVEVVGTGEIADLGHEVNHMAATIAQIQSELVDRERLAAMGEVVRRIVHNLRNPLAGIRSLAELTRADLPAGSDLRENQDRIVKSVDRFESWLGDVLRATRPLEIRPDEVKIEAWLAGVVDAQRPAAEAAGIRIDIDASAGPATAEFDARHVEQALVALITNALQASPAGTSVTVTTETGNGDGTWLLRVADQGPGVPEHLRDTIFRPYFTTKRDGTGIGLALVRQVAEQHGGRALLMPRPSDPGGQDRQVGAEFVLVLPRISPSRPAKAGQDGDSGGQSSGR